MITVKLVLMADSIWKERLIFGIIILLLLLKIIYKKLFF